MSEHEKDPHVEDAAPSCPHDEMEPYWADSPVGESFAAGVLAEADLGGLQLADETPWRGHAGAAPDQAKLGRREPEPGSPEARAEAQQARIDAADATARAREAMAKAVAAQKRRDDERQGIETSAGNPAAVDPDLGSIRVLVVHPNATTRRQVARALGALGFETTTCADAARATMRAVQERPDAVIVELGSDGVDALALCRTLRDRAADVPVLIVAAGEDEAHYSVAMEAGAADYLRQPVTPAGMGDRLRIAVRKSRAQHPRPQPLAGTGSDSASGTPGGLSDPDLVDRQLRRQQLKIQSLFELSRNVVGCLELDELYQGFLLTAMGQLGLSAGILYHLDSGRGGRVVEVVSRGIPRNEAETLLDFRTALGMFLLRSPHPVLLEPDCCPPELRGEVERMRRAGLSVACPMASKGTAVGVALFGGRIQGHGFAADDLLMLSAVCNFAGPALESARLFTELQLTYLSTVRAFVSSLEAKDAYTRGHSERVADYSRALAQSCGFKRRELDMIVFGGMLHDIGKIGVSEGILNKPAPLTPEEWRVVRGHPEMGARIVSHIDYLAPAVPMILHHHERIDGRGYPHGLTGDDIELGARIVTVADSFDAMTTHRPYRRAMDVAQAAKLLRAHAGRQFDAQIVETFLGLLESGTVKAPS